MKSSSGQHYAGLDHLRALAAFLVVLWHFAHGATGGAPGPVPFGQAPEVGLLDEGHVGVSLFMVLSGYLFAKLIDRQRIDYGRFLWNRLLRLLPLLLVALAAGYAAEPASGRAEYVHRIYQSAILPTLPMGGWSIFVEAQFYVLLPFLLRSCERRWYAPYLVVALALLLRSMLAASGANMQFLSYYWLFGRIDQFALGIAAFYRPPGGRTAALLFAGLLGFYCWFDAAGGFYGHLSPVVWTVLPLIEAAGFAALVSWYDRHPLRGKWLRPVQLAGEYSYSIYLLHLLLVGKATGFVDQHVVRLTNIYLAIPFALLFFAVMAAIGRVTFTWIEAPFLRFRVPYVLDRQAGEAPSNTSGTPGRPSPMATTAPAFRHFVSIIVSRMTPSVVLNSTFRVLSSAVTKQAPNPPV